MSDVNLHLTGDIHAVTATNNLLCAAVDARMLHEGTQKTPALFKRLVPKKFAPVQLEYLKKLGIAKTDPKDLTPEEQERFSRLDIDPETISIKRVIDCNDRFLRDIRIGLGAGEKAFARNTGFDIAVASEVMAVLALAADAADLKRRLNNIVVARNRRGEPVTVGDVGVGGAMAALMNDAVMPNLLQTLEGTPIFMHAGPFANVAHGQSSVIADEIALRLAGPSGFCVTESGFGADMGFEKFVGIKSRATGVAPDVAVIVMSSRAMRMHGEYLLGEGADPQHTLERGCENVKRHIHNLVTHYHTPVVVAITRSDETTPAEAAMLERICVEAGAQACVPFFGWSGGSAGAERLARAVLSVTDAQKSTPQLKQLYSLDEPIADKIRKIATKIYGAKDIELSPKAKVRSKETDVD
jgi:methylenetetrahydrofolate dehydrogenase (NADP+)/methenyltetrahydrofolate cyclohydrolase/formyltetrahydrofolate synthetase